ncbi:MAG: DegT/DnrJ/EryC1/StrS family aminotransferase [Bacteroidetes bacterium]|nr:DegT/DnrJ/EryC1/StrS family aminotransferase [Bacteroidota bacterium]
MIPISQPSITQKEIDYVTDAVKSTWISSLGKYIDKFESDFARFCGTKHAIAVSNGTVAIHLALVAHRIGPGDEVIIPNLTFVATANAVLHAGAVPVLVDIDPFNLCIDPNKIEEAITPRTKAIMPVHLYGHPCDMKAIIEIAKRNNLLVIEDAAEAHGAKAYGKTVGNWGDCATFSFYGNKNLTTGEGGMITTNDEEYNLRCRYLRDHAMSKEKRYWHTEVGYNYRMTNIQAALGCAQLERIQDLMQKRAQLFSWYSKALNNIDGLQLNRTSDWATNSYWLICLQNSNWKTEQERDEFMLRLKSSGVDSRPFFYPLSEMPYLKADVDTPVTHAVYKRGINLPTFYDLAEDQVKTICDCIIENLNA